ncbi:hypothetical protein Tco_1572777, partial [Tanacetum coccineum]
MARNTTTSTKKGKGIGAMGRWEEVRGRLGKYYEGMG